MIRLKTIRRRRRRLTRGLWGGRWYFPATYNNLTTVSPKTSEGYYKFTEDGKLIYSSETTYYKNIADNLSGSTVFSKDGIVYIGTPNRNIMKYDFNNYTFPFKDGDIPNDTTYPTTGDQLYSLNKLAKKGDLITYRIYNGGSLYSDSRYGSYWFLVRFKDDGTPYRSSTEYQSP